MTEQEALNLISIHSGRNDKDTIKWQEGFVGSLRYFNGSLKEENFIEVMECLKTLEALFLNKMMDKDLISDIYNILYYPALWIQEKGYLDWIANEEKKKLKEWLNIYAYAIGILFDANEDASEEAFYEYEEYLKGNSNYD